MPEAHIWGKDITIADSSYAEFKEIRKEWKAKKKEEEAARKADDERHRQADPRGGEQHDQPPYGQMRTPLGPPPNMGGPQLPPIGYPPQQGGPPPQQYGQPQPSPGMENMGQYASSYRAAHSEGTDHPRSYPQSPYGQGGQVYQQRCQPSLTSGLQVKLTSEAEAEPKYQPYPQ